MLQIRIVNLLTLILNSARHLQMKRLGTNQVCNLQFDCPHDSIVCSFWFDRCNLSISAAFCHKLCSMMLLTVPEYLFIDHNESGRPCLATYKHFSTISALQRALRLFHNLPKVFDDRLCMALPPAEKKVHLSWLIHSISHSVFVGMTFHVIAPSSGMFQ